MIRIEPPVRGSDAHGSGAYGAPRGDRTHNGIDLSALPGSYLLAPINGAVRVGYPYADDLSFKYVEILNAGTAYRFFYVRPLDNIGGWVEEGQRLGVVQNLAKRYPGITNHIHFEVKRGREYIDPRPFLEG